MRSPRSTRSSRASGTVAKLAGAVGSAPPMAVLNDVFKAYDIRGTVPDQLDAGLCRAVGAAFARFAGAPTVLVARDMRPSGVELARAFAEGVTSQGADVVDLGLASTDMIYFASGWLDAPGAMFTASHNPADPIQPENLKDLQARVLETGADVGLAFDGDADRVFLVDERAQPLSGSTVTAMVATVMLERYPGATIIHNLICSKAVPEIVREHGGVPVVTRVGHSFIKAVMAETGAVFGGEHSAHYYFRDNYRADSGSVAALVVLELLSKQPRPLSELRRP